MIALLITCCASLEAIAWPVSLEPAFTPPSEYRHAYGDTASLLKKERAAVLADWHRIMGAWPALLERPTLEIKHSEPREDFTQEKVRVQVALHQSLDGYLLRPKSGGPHPAVIVPFYDPETSIGLAGKPMRDFALQLTRHGFITLSIGSPGGDARKPDLAGAICQPLSYLAYIAANCHTALSQLPEVDAKRIGIVGHSYGGKWAMFASCLYDKFACAAWSDPGIAFDEERGNVNYWEPWYLGYDPARPRPYQGLLRSGEARQGAYARLIQEQRDLSELHILMAPRPFLVSGGAEDPPSRWRSLNRVIEYYESIGAHHRVGMTNRALHDPDEVSNAAIYDFFIACLKPTPAKP